MLALSKLHVRVAYVGTLTNFGVRASIICGFVGGLVARRDNVSGRNITWDGSKKKSEYSSAAHSEIGPFDMKTKLIQWHHM